MVYVDPLMGCVPNARWRWSQSCHLFADTLEELHAFATKIGLKRAWFQNRPTLAHYDLNAGRRAAALRAGAVELGFREAVAKWRTLKHCTACAGITLQQAINSNWPISCQKCGRHYK